MVLGITPNTKFVYSLCTVCLTVLFLRNDLSVAGGTEPQVTEV